MTDFEAVVTPRITELRYYAKKLTRSDPDADDLLQNTLLHALTRWDRFDRARNVYPWLCTLMHNLHCDAVRTAKRRAQKPVELEPDVVAFEYPQSYTRRFEAVLEMLSPKLREALELVYVAELTLDDAGAVMGVGKMTCSSRRHRAVEQMRQLLENQNGVY